MQLINKALIETITFKCAGLFLLSNFIPADRSALPIDCEQMKFQQINGSALNRLYSLNLCEPFLLFLPFLASKKFNW